MKNKKTIKIIGLFVLVYLIMSGLYINDKVTSNIFLYGFIDFIIISVVMMIIPLTYVVINKRKIDEHQGRKILKTSVLVSLVFLFILNIIIWRGVYDETFENLGRNMVLSYIYYIINRNIFVLSESNQAKYTNKQKDKKNNFERKIKYCKNCGGKIDLNKKCTNCGKQYFKFNGKNLSLFIVSLLLLTSIILNIYCLVNKKELEDEVITLQDVFLDQTIDSANYQEKSNFLDDNIVFVIEGYGNYYYTYDCMQRITENDYSYWAYNVEQAKSNGYKKGTCD